MVGGLFQWSFDNFFGCFEVRFWLIDDGAAGTLLEE